MKPIKELHQLVDELTEFIQDIVPNAHVEYERFIFTDEDANLRVFPPLTWDEDQGWELQQKITEHVVDVHLETGYLILTSVYTPQQQVVEIKSELAKSKQKVQFRKIFSRSRGIRYTSTSPCRIRFSSRLTSNRLDHQC
jgi:hypothetical protein